MDRANRVFKLVEKNLKIFLEGHVMGVSFVKIK